jgi:cytochrome c biogenesis protein CcmG/thiol:disulfide interchange protein DsbE
MVAAASRRRRWPLVLVPSAEMKVRLSIVAGLLAGVAVAALVFGGIVAFAPAPAPLTSAAPSFAIASAAPSALESNPPSVSPSASTVASGGTKAFHIGEPAPALVVPQVGGGTIDLANLKGKPVWINFMATWCPPCQDEFPLMNGFAARYARTGLVIMAIDVKEEEGAVGAFAEQLNATFPLGLDSDGIAADTWDAVALPVHFWIGADGIVRDGALGGIGPDVMANGLRKILPGVNVTP